MLRRWRLLIAAIVLVVVGGVAACTSPAPRSLPRPESSAVIDMVAWWLDVPLNGTGPSNYSDLTLPDNFQETDFYKFESAWRVAFDRNWNKVLESRNHGDGGWPGDVRFMTNAKGDTPDSGGTRCPELNNDNQVVTPDSLSIFYCVRDPMRAPGTPKYEQGTLWVPVAELTRLGREVRIGGTQATRAEQVTQAAFVHLTASWADALTRQLRAYAVQRTAQLPRFERSAAAHEFGYCIAGAMGRTVFGTSEKSVVVDALPPNVQNDPVLEGKIAALRSGFSADSLGSCIASHWPKADTPN